MLVFIERNFELLKQNGYLSMITMHSWMFLSSYEKFREKLIGSKDIVNMAHLGARAFEEIGGEVVQTTAFVMRRSNVSGYLGTYERLVNYASQYAKEEAFLVGNNRHIAKKSNFDKIPGSPFAYWINNYDVFAHKQFLERFCSGGRNKTHNNETFVRSWWEPFLGGKWESYYNGGNYRKWYGNSMEIVDWSSYAKSQYKSHGGLVNERFVHTEGIVLCWFSLMIKNHRLLITFWECIISISHNNLLLLSGT